MSSKRIRVLYSPLTERFYATKAWKDEGDGVVIVTGEKWDVTQDIASLVDHYKIEFVKSCRETSTDSDE